MRSWFRLSAIRRECERNEDVNVTVDRFISTITEKGRSKVIEEVNPDSKTTELDEAILVLRARVARVISSS